MKTYVMYGVIGIVVVVVATIYLIMELKQNANESIGSGVVRYDQQFFGEYPAIRDVLTGVQKIFSGTHAPDGGVYFEYESMPWINDAGWLISSDRSPQLSAYYLCSIATEKITSRVPKIYSELDDIFAENGFKLNATNTMNSFDQALRFSLGTSYSRAYEKNEVKCVANAAPECFGLPGGYGEQFGSPVSVTCTDTISENEMLQVPLLKEIGSKEDSIRSVNQFGQFLFVGFMYDHAIVKRNENGAHEVLYRGQDYPTCEMAEEKALPKELKSFLGLQCS